MNNKGIVPLLLAPLASVIGVLAILLLLVFGVGGLSLILNYTAIRIGGIIILGIAGLAVFVTKKIDTFTFVLALIGAVMVILEWLV